MLGNVGMAQDLRMGFGGFTQGTCGNEYSESGIAHGIGDLITNMQYRFGILGGLHVFHNHWGTNWGLDAAINSTLVGRT